ncbi:MAG: HAD family hydrolase [Bacteroides sp.]|nr:HAD family hydrolase [Bacteroides sp.]MCM1472089.1 HAD family hydrolase [Bacteroides sp.]
MKADHQITPQFGALFDLDGVIIDSETDYTGFWREIDRIYPTGVENFAIAIKGTTLEEIMLHFPDPTEQEDIISRIDRFQSEMVYHLFDGVEAFLKDLHRHGIPMALVTSSDERKMSRLFSQIPWLKEMFVKVIDAQCVTHSKPHPEGYLKAAEAIGLDARRCFVFEDSLQGIRAGKAAGARVIGIATTLPRQAIEHEADRMVDLLSQLSYDSLINIVK